MYTRQSYILCRLSMLVSILSQDLIFSTHTLPTCNQDRSGKLLHYHIPQIFNQTFLPNNNLWMNQVPYNKIHCTPSYHSDDQTRDCRGYRILQGMSNKIARTKDIQHRSKVRLTAKRKTYSEKKDIFSEIYKNNISRAYLYIYNDSLVRLDFTYKLYKRLEQMQSVWVQSPRSHVHLVGWGHTGVNTHQVTW